MKTLQLKQDFYWAGILDKNLRVFDIIMYTEFGTTYNSYILKAGDETILLKPRRKILRRLQSGIVRAAGYRAD